MATTTTIDPRKAALRVLQVFQQMIAPCSFNEKFALPGGFRASDRLVGTSSRLIVIVIGYFS